MKNSKLKKSRIDLLPAFVRGASVALFVSVLSVGSVAQATSIPMLKNVTTGDTIFNDDFESISVPDAPTALNKPTFGSPLVGNWTAASITNPTGYVEGVTNEARSGVVPQQGTNFFTLSSVPTFGGSGAAWTGLGVVANSGLGDTVEANIAFNLEAGSNRALFYLYGGASRNILLGAFGLEGTHNAFTDYSVTSHNGTDFQQTTLTFLPDEWNTLTISHVNGANKDYAISINGGTAVTYDGFASAAVNGTSFVNSIYFNQTSSSTPTAGTTVYFDAVAIPEPSSILLMGVGVLSMVVIGRNRKSRR